MKYALNNHDLVARFVASLIPHVRARGFGNCRAIGICDDKDELVAGLVFSHFDPEAEVMEISGAALPGHFWATPQTLQLLHGYPFGQCGCQMVIMRVQASDERLLRQLKSLGYEFVGLPRIFGRDKDGIYCWLTKEAWMENRITKRLFRSMMTPSKREAA